MLAIIIFMLPRRSLCSPNEDFGRIDKRWNPDFRHTFQWFVAQIEYSRPWKVLRKSGFHLLSILPKSSFGRDKVELDRHIIVLSSCEACAFDMQGSYSRSLKQRTQKWPHHCVSCTYTSFTDDTTVWVGQRRHDGVSWTDDKTVWVGQTTRQCELYWHIGMPPSCYHHLVSFTDYTTVWEYSNDTSACAVIILMLPNRRFWKVEKRLREVYGTK